MAAVQAGNIVSQRQANAGPGGITHVFQTVKRQHGLGDLVFSNTRSAVLHAQLNGIVSRAQVHRHDALLRRVFDRVLQQVGAEFTQQHVITLNHYRLLYAVITEIDTLAARLRQPGKAAVLHHLHQIDRGKLSLPLLFSLHR